MSKKNDGGQAFPATGEYVEFDQEEMTERYSGVHFESPGMTIRDYFAGQALAGQVNYEGLEGMDAKLVAGCAYELADAMLAERDK